MAISSERGENNKAESGERLERGAESAAEWARGGAKELHESIDRGDTFEKAARGLAGELAHSIIERIELGRELVSALRGLLAEAGPALGEWGARLSEGLGEVDRVLGEGSEWLAEHPEIIDACVQLLCVAALACLYPEQALTLLRERPDLVLDPLSTLLGARSRGLA